jgi:hypothetical protein
MEPIWFLEYSKNKEKKGMFPFQIIELTEMIRRNSKSCKGDSIEYDWLVVEAYKTAAEGMQILLELRNAEDKTKEILDVHPDVDTADVDVKIEHLEYW